MNLRYLGVEKSIYIVYMIDIVICVDVYIGFIWEGPYHTPFNQIGDKQKCPTAGAQECVKIVRGDPTSRCRLLMRTELGRRGIDTEPREHGCGSLFKHGRSSSAAALYDQCQHARA